VPATVARLLAAPILGIFEGVGMVAAAAWIAPARKKQIPAVIAATVFCVLALSAAVTFLLEEEWDRLLEVGVAAASAIGMAVSLAEDDKKSENLRNQRN